MQLSEQELVRRSAKEQMEQLGINPYPSALFPVTHYAKQIKREFDEKKAAEFKEVTLAGRIMSRRIMAPLRLLNCRTQQVASSFTFAGMIYARKRTKHFTILFLRSWLILVILLE